MAVQAPLNVDEETSSLLDHGAQVLGMTREDLVASAVRAYVASRRGRSSARCARPPPAWTGRTRPRSRCSPASRSRR